MAKAKRLTRTDCTRGKENLHDSLDRQSFELRFKAVHQNAANGSVARRGYKWLCEGLEGAIISSSTVHIPTKPKDLKRFSKHLRLWKETSILRLCLVLRSVGALVQDWCIGWPPGRGHADCRLLLIANVIRLVVGVRLCDPSRILYACQKAESCSRCLNIPNVTYSWSCRIEMVVDSSRVPQYPFLLYVRIAKTASPRSCLTRDVQCDHVYECLDEVSCLGQGSQGATIAGSRSNLPALPTLQALHDVVTCGGVDDCIRRNDTSTN